jgi:hypothetical protein
MKNAGGMLRQIVEELDSNNDGKIQYSGMCVVVVSSEAAGGARFWQSNLLPCCLGFPPLATKPSPSLDERL